MAKKHVLFGFLFPFFVKIKNDLGKTEELHNLQYSNLWKEDFRVEQQQQQQQDAVSRRRRKNWT